MSHTYEDVIRMAVSDFEEFFDSNPKFTVNLKIENSRKIAKVSGNAEHSTLIFDKFSAGVEITSLDDVLFCLLIIGHELAHYVNNHMAHNDESKRDSAAIEGWADYFGARICFALITYGENISGLIAGLTSIPFAKPAPFSKRQDMILRSMGRALSRAYETLYKPGDSSGRYLSSSMRTYTFLGGVTSFFYRSMGVLNETWLLYVYQRLGCDNNLADTVYNPSEGFVDDAHFSRTQEIHAKIQGDERPFITAGLKVVYWNLMGTGYVASPKERLRSKERIESQFKGWKFKVDV